MRDNSTTEYDYGLNVQEETVFNNGLCIVQCGTTAMVRVPEGTTVNNGLYTRWYDSQQWIMYKMVQQSTMDYVQEEKHTKTAEIKQDRISDVHQ